LSAWVVATTEGNKMKVKKETAALVSQKIYEIGKNGKAKGGREKKWIDNVGFAPPRKIRDYYT
jgi:hypothetical protein